MELLRRYRFLMLVYGLAMFAGIVEYLDRYPPDEPAQVMLDLYPESSEINYKLARFFESQGDLSKARTHFEKALATGVKTDENLFWHYALTLVRLQADPAQIEQAVADWRYNFPDSARVDPRDPQAVEVISPPMQLRTSEQTSR